VTQINHASPSDQLSPLFSFYLSKTPSEDGYVTFGGYDIGRFAKPGSSESSVFWAEISTFEKLWTLPMNSPALETRNKSSTQPLMSSKAKYAVMDTGVSYALIP